MTAARDQVLNYLDNKRAACQDCFCVWHCAGDCFTRSYYAEASSRPGANPRCIMNREITAGILLWYIMEGDGTWRGQGAHPGEMQLMRSF